MFNPYFYECLEENGKSVLEIDLTDFTEKTKAGEELIDYFCTELKSAKSNGPLLHEKKFDKIVFVLNILGHVQLMKNFIDDLQSRKFSSTFPEEIDKYMTSSGHSNFKFSWPDSWFIHIRWINYLMMNNKIPDDLWTLPNIEVLCLKNQRLLELPNYVGQLRNLKVLNVTENDLKTLPPTLCLCSKLTEIRMGYNRITSLPAYFMNMKHLERMERYSYSHANAPMIDVSERPGYPIKYICDKEGEKIENNADGNEDKSNNKKNNVTSPDSLYRLAAYAALKHDFKMFSNTGSKVLPKHVVNDITCSLPSLRFCDNCHCGFAEKEYHIVKKLFKDFKGYKNNVFEAVTCSSVCCDAIFNEWTSVAEKEIKESEDEQYCFDVNDYFEHDDNDENGGEATNPNTSSRNWFRKLFACF